jgi:hypothetical protein
MAQDIYQVNPLPFSTRVFNDFSPVYYKDGIVFCTDRRKSIFNVTSNQKNEPQLDLYFIRKMDSLHWSRPVAFANELNSLKFEGPLTFSSDWNTVYFTRNYDNGTKRNSRKDNRNFGIFTARWDGGKWVDIQPFEYNDPQYKTGHPSLSADGQYLFFTSDRPDGVGKSDIYYCRWDGTHWSAPVNCGNVVNTPGKEAFPFIHRSGRLYFASDGPSSQGGLDIFYALFSEGNFTELTRLSAPFNSSDDDFAFVADQYLENGFFSSNRRRADNLFSFTTLVKRFVNCPQVEENERTYVITEPNARQLDTLHHDFVWDLGDGARQRGIEVEHTYQQAGDYVIKLDVVDSLTGEILYNQATYNLPVQDIEQVYFSAPDTVYTNEKINLDGKNTNLPGFDIQGYLWNFGDGTIATEPSIIHVFKTPGVYNMQLVVESMPDPSGNTRKECGCRNITVLPGRRR